MLFGNRIEVKNKEINEAYEEFLNNNKIILLCADEEKWFDERHLKDAQCFPLRVIDKDAKNQLDNDLIYYVYSMHKGTSYEAVKKLLKLGFEAYDLGSYISFKGPEEGLKVKGRKFRRKR